jgi:hypothetical protein
MSIRFICTCGKHLKARDEMAARRSVCPRCRRPVGVPSPEASQRGAPAGPLTPAERRERARLAAARGESLPSETPTVIVPFATNPFQDSLDVAAKPLSYCAVELPVADQEAVGSKPAEPLLKSAVHSRRSRREIRRRPRHWRRETHWYECWQVPWLTCHWQFILALVLTMGTAAMVLIGWPVLADDPDITILLAVSPAVLAPAVFVCVYLQCVLRSAVVGAPPNVIWPDGNLVQLVVGTARWLACLLTGPVVLILVAGNYWIWCGELDLLNELILLELSFFAAGYGLFTLLAVTRSGRLLDANPVRVATLVHTLGPRTAVFAVAAWLLLLGHGWCLLAVAQNLLPAPGGTFAGWVSLILCWFSSLFCATFLLRLLGLWSYHKLGLVLNHSR